ncbi:putative D,D-dipeptide transport system permease protein DdpC [Streptomyces sp. RB5]|uniref:Putative D,D-dipeptide transport system permease protein DdpC n=1 Tax=Streptomyces smaragdinus TaxID=2585196 RepID=A0A7K0CSM6_9ACTN|nr:ABC transporter permease [Streptomyces smaragdinus]MQY16450.1 putative D,D-dipeptide transport system permease protein DdpC [Streptomyces smaragdinus]
MTTQAPRARHDPLTRGVWHDRNGRAGTILTAALLLACLTAAAGLLPYDPLAQDPTTRLRAPSAAHWFGTDQFGRDVLARTLTGIAASLRVAAVAVACAALIGSFLGVLAGYVRGRLDAVVSRLADILFAFPAILLALAIVAALGQGWFNTAVAIAVVYTPIFLRVARGPTLSVREAEYVKAAKVLGYGPARILLRHVVPNVSAPVVVQTTLALSWAILTESGLSFLGLGTQPPQPSLGLMVSEARNLLTEAWWTLAFPAALIVVAVVALNLLGDGLRAALDPREGTR